MKSILIIIFSLLYFSLFANFVKNQPFEQIQPDSTVLNLFVTGDEYYHRVHDANGYTILLHPKTGYAVYAVPDGNSIKASDNLVGKVDPSTLGIAPNLMKYMDPLEMRRPNHIPTSNNGNRFSAVGTINNIVIFIRFQDQSEFPSTPSYSTYGYLFNSASQQSMKDYYNEVSTGQLTINSYLYRSSGDQVISIQAADARGWYSPWSETNLIGYPNDAVKMTRLAFLVGEICTIADFYIPDGIDVDTNDDGVNDALTFIVRGAPDTWGDLLWPTHWPMAVPVGVLNGVPITHFAMDFETGIGASVICHEMGHNIGFPDLYHYVNYFLDPVAEWDLMSNDKAQHETTYMKYEYGTWFPTIPTIVPTSTPTQYTLTAIDQSPYSCYKIASNYPNQFYMLEYRRKTGRYESGIPESGLIVYRITDTWGGNNVRGNSAGPPDEVYIYRPGGDVGINGSWSTANFSSTVGRTAIHNYTDPQPWIFIDSFEQADGNLSIVDIGPSGGTTITFTVLNTPPNVWKGVAPGSEGYNWNNPANWSLGVVPTSEQYVEIPNIGYAPYPRITTTAHCYHLTIKPYAQMTIQTGTLYVGTDIDNNGELVMDNASGNLVVSRDLFFLDGSTATVTANATIHVQRDVEFSAGSVVNMSYGTLRFYGTGNSYLRINDSASICNFRSDKDDTYSTRFSGIETESLTIRGNLHVYPESTAYNSFGGTINVHGNLEVFTNGICQFNSGTLSFGGVTAGSSSINFWSAGSYMRNLRINKNASSSVSLSSYLELKGFLAIDTGTFNAASYTITIGGDWINTVGPSAFTEGTSTVIFNNIGDQYCNYSETFNALEINKPGGTFRIDSTTAIVTCASYNWTAGSIFVNGGTFTANDLVDTGIFGSWTLESGTINLTNNDGYVDLNGNIDIWYGNFNVYGGTDESWWTYAGNVSFSMSGGTLDFKNRGINLSSTGYSFSENIIGGTIRAAGGFQVARTNFHPTAGWVEVYGSADGSISLGAGSNFNNLYINKTSSKDYDIESPGDNTDRMGHMYIPQRTNVLTATTDLDINGNFLLHRGTFVAPAQMNVAGNWLNEVGTTGFTEGTGLVVFDGVGNSTVYGETFNNLEMNKSGSAGILMPSGITTCNSYNWTAGTLNVSGGTFTALDMADDAILGTILLSAGYINFHQDVSSYLDLRANVTINGGGLHVYGGTGDMLWPYLGSASLSLSSGVFEVNDRLLYVFSGNTFTTSITGGTIRVAKGFYCDRADFIPTGGTLEMFSTNDGNLNIIAGSIANMNLVINKAARSVEEESSGGTGKPEYDGPRNQREETRANTASVIHNFSCKTLTINAGILNVGAYALTCSGHMNINNGGTFSLGAGGILYMYSAKYLWVNSGGTFSTIGTSTAGATVTTSAGYFYFNVELGGTIRADYTIFEKLGANGVEVKTGATVDLAHAFYGCTFRSGLNTGTLLTLDNNQNLLISNAAFPTNTWSGNSNVKKSVDAGVVNFANATGGFSGESYDSDVNGRIIWSSPTASFDLQIVRAVWVRSSVPIGETATLVVTCLNASTTVCNVASNYLDLYHNRTTAPPTSYAGDQWITLASLPAGLPVDYSFPVTNINPANEGVWNAWLQIDTDQHVTETNETNNIVGPIPLTWVYLPPIASLAINYAGSNQIRLHWTYPKVVDWFAVYRSTTPNLSVSSQYLLGYTTYPTMNYFDTMNNSRYFYIVTAQLDDDPQDKNVIIPLETPIKWEENSPRR